VLGSENTITAPATTRTRQIKIARFVFIVIFSTAKQGAFEIQDAEQVSSSIGAGTILVRRLRDYVAPVAYKAPVGYFDPIGPMPKWSVKNFPRIERSPASAVDRTPPSP
jgi:hypothetical protein